MKNISRIAIIKGFNPEKNKNEIERVVIFYDDSSVDVQKYNRTEHLNLVADYLELNDMDILDDGLRKGIEANLISIINREDKLAMRELRNEVLEAQILGYGEENTLNKEASLVKELKREPIKTATETPVVPVAKEVKPEIVEIPEETKEEVKEETALESDKKELPEEFREVNSYFILNNLRENGKATVDDLAEIRRLAKKNERVAKLEDARTAYLRNNVESKSEYAEVYNAQRDALREAVRAIAMPTEVEEVEEAPVLEVKAEPVIETKEEVTEDIVEEEVNEEPQNDTIEEAVVETVETKDEVKEETPVVKAEEPSNKEKEMLEYFRLYLLRDNGKLTVKGAKRIEELRTVNSSVAELEEAREEFMAGTKNKEEFKAAEAKQRKEVEKIFKYAPESEEVKETKEVVKPVVVATPVVEAKEEKVEEAKEAPETESEFIKTFIASAKKENKKEREEAIPVEGEVSESEEEKEEEDKSASKKFILVGNPYESVPTDRNKLPKKKTKLPAIVLNRTEEVPGKRVVGVIPEDDKSDPTITEEEVVVPIVEDGEHHEEGKITVKKHNRVIAFALGLALGLSGSVAWILSKLGKEKEVKPQVTPTATVKVETTPEAKNSPEPKVTPVATATVEAAMDKETATPTVKPNATPTTEPTATPTVDPTATPTTEPTATPTVEPTATPTVEPTATPTVAPTPEPTVDVALIAAGSVADYCEEMHVSDETRAFLNRADVINFLSGFVNGEQRKEVISALAFGYEMNFLTKKNGNFRTEADGDNYLKSFCYDFICAKAVINGYTPEQMATAFGKSNITYEQMMDGFHNFYNMMAVYGIYGVEVPPFRYLTNGETKDCKAFTELFNSLAVVNFHRKTNTLTSAYTDDFIVTVDKLYGRGGGTQFTTEGAATFGMSLVNAYDWGQANIARGEALKLQKDHGVSRAGLTLSADEDGHWEIDGFNYLDLFTQANKGWGNETDYNDRCYKYRQRLAENLEMGRVIANGSDRNSRYEFADKLEDYPELAGYADEVRSNKYTLEQMEEIYDIAEDKYPNFIREINTFVIGHNSAIESDDLVALEEYAPKVDAFFGIGLREDYDISEVMIYYVNKAYQEGLNITFTDENGKVIGGPKKPGSSQPSGPSKPATPTPHVTVTTTETPVDYDDLTPEEQHQADEQVQQMQQEEEEEWQETIEHAQETADDVTTQLHEGTMTDEEAVAALEEAGITVDPDYIETMHEIHEEEVQVQHDAEQQAQELTQQEEQQAEEHHQEEEQHWEQQQSEEDALIQASMELEAAEEDPAPQPEPEPQPEPQPEPEPEPAPEPPAPEPPAPEPPAPAEPSPDEEIDPEFGSDDEEPYTGKRKELVELRNLVASLGDFGLTEDRGRSLTL